MNFNLSVLAQAVEAISLAVKDVEKGIASGGGVIPEVVNIAEDLWNDAAFKSAVINLVNAIKA